MPISADKIREFLIQKLGNDIYSNEECRAFARMIEEQGVDEAGVKAALEIFQDKLEDTHFVEELGRFSGRPKNLNNTLELLNSYSSLPVNQLDPPRNPDNSINFIALITRAISKPEDPVPVAVDLPTDTFGGQKIGVTKQGQLTIDGEGVVLSIAPPNQPTADALWALCRPGQLTDLDPAIREKLLDNIRIAVMAGLAVEDPKSAPMFRRNSALCAGLGGLAAQAEHWSQATCHDMLAAAETAPTVFMKALVYSGLQKAPLTESQKEKLDTIQPQDDADTLVSQYDEMRQEDAKAGWTTVTGLAAQIALSAMTFSKKAESATAFLGGLKVWAELSPCWGAEHMAKLDEVLEVYVDGNDSLGYVYGSFEADAPTEVAKITSAEAVTKARPELEANPPSLLGYPLSREQADFLLSSVQENGPAIIESVRNTEAVENLARCLAMAASTFEKSPASTWGNIPTADKPLNAAAFKLFRRAVTEYQQTLSGSKDKKLGYDDLLSQLKYQTKDIREVLYPRLVDMDGTPPAWNGITLDAAAKTYLTDLMNNRIRGVMSVENIDRAVLTVGAKYGNKLEGDGSAKFREIVDSYQANWPHYSFLDFNKLERIAKCVLDGVPIPTFEVNGHEISLGFFYTAVGLTVQQKADCSTFPEAPWMPARWGFRAKQSVELLDVIAERAIRGEGPLAILQKQFPEQPIEIEVMGGAGEHNMFIYNVGGKKFVEAVSVNQDGSTTGTIAAYTPPHYQSYGAHPAPPRLFTATVDAQGGLSLSVDDFEAENYPLQNFYGVGCRIDVKVWDQDAEEKHEEKDPFSTKYKVCEAVILGYTADGQYTVSYVPPNQSEPITTTLSLDKIQNANDPHFFRFHNGQTADMWETRLDHKNGKHLQAFVQEAAAIGEKFLPSGDPSFDPETGVYDGGSIVALSAKELQQAQMECNKALLHLGREWMRYPSDEDSGYLTEDEKKYHQLQNETPWWDKIPFDSLLGLKLGVCRHQAEADQIMDQTVGIDSRISRGAANTSSGNFRGFHAWSEDDLVLGFKVLDDLTWSDTNIPLWLKAYGVDLRRQEMYNRTSKMDHGLAPT